MFGLFYFSGPTKGYFKILFCVMGVLIVLVIGAAVCIYKVSICLHVFFSALISHSSGFISCRMMGLSSTITLAFKRLDLHRHVFDRNSSKVELNRANASLMLITIMF